MTFLLLGSTGISAGNIGGTINHSGLRIKPGIKLFGLNEKSKAFLRDRLSEVKFLITDCFYMVSNDLWTDINSRLGEMFMMITKKAFASLSGMTVAHLLQLSPVRGKLIFSRLSNKDSIKHLLGLQLWYLFQYAELTGVKRQIDKLFVDFELVKFMMMLKSYSRQELHINLVKIAQKDALQMYAENEPAMGRNDAVLNDLPGELYTIEAHSKITDNCKHPLTEIKAARNLKQTNAGGLAKLLKVKIGAKVMVTVNLEIQGWLKINEIILSRQIGSLDSY